MPGAAADFGIGRLFDLVPDAVIVGEAGSGRVVLWNRGAEEVFGYPATEAVGMDLADLVAPDLRAAHLRGVAGYVAGERGRVIDSLSTAEVRARHRDGRELWVEMRLASLDTPGRDAPGAARPVLAVLRDVTARKEAESLAGQRQEDLEGAHETLRDFVSITAHDLRAPLAAITSALAMVERMPLSDEQRSEMIGLAHRQAGLMAQVLDELVDAGRIESGKVEVRLEDFPLQEAVSDAIQAAASEAPAVLVPSDLRVRADRSHVTRVITNLLTNATRYGAPPVEVSALFDDPSRQSGGSPDPASGTPPVGNPYVVVRVRDHGEGVAPELADRIFDKFSKGAGSSGMGLGLAISRGLAEANDGRLDYEPAPGGGSCFLLRLPPAEPPTVPSA